MEVQKWGELDRGVQMDFYTASALGLLDKVQDYILRGQNINEKNYEGWTALMYACYYEREDIVTFLVIKNGANKCIFNNDKRSAMFIAAILGNVNILKQVIHGSIIDVHDNFDCTALFYAVVHRNYECVEYLLKQGCNPDLLCHNKTILMYCSDKGCLEMLRLLLKYGANVHISNREGKTALDYAQLNDHTQIVRLLAIHGQNDIQKILKTLGLEKYWKYFQERSINYAQFLNMTEEDMKNIGINIFGPRRRLSLLIADIKACSE